LSTGGCESEPACRPLVMVVSARGIKRKCPPSLSDQSMAREHAQDRRQEQRQEQEQRQTWLMVMSGELGHQSARRDYCCKYLRAPTGTRKVMTTTHRGDQDRVGVGVGAVAVKTVMVWATLIGDHMPWWRYGLDKTQKGLLCSLPPCPT